LKSYGDAISGFTKQRVDMSTCAPDECSIMDKEGKGAYSSGNDRLLIGRSVRAVPMRWVFDDKLTFAK
jgi:hypothetical protein